MGKNSIDQKEQRELIAHLMRRAGFGATSNEIDELAESLFSGKFLTGYNVPWVEEARAKHDGIIVSTGSLGRAFRRHILIPSSDSSVTMIAFTANPDYLDQHVELFMRVRGSIYFR